MVDSSGIIYRDSLINGRAARIEVPPLPHSYPPRRRRRRSYTQRFDNGKKKKRGREKNGRERTFQGVAIFFAPTFPIFRPLSISSVYVCVYNISSRLGLLIFRSRFIIPPLQYIARELYISTILIHLTDRCWMHYFSLSHFLLFSLYIRIRAQTKVRVYTRIYIYIYAIVGRGGGRRREILN